MAGAARCTGKITRSLTLRYPRPPLTAPLDGITILDLTRLLPGPVATMHLADRGATVIKIEDKGVGDDARTSRAADSGWRCAE